MMRSLAAIACATMLVVSVGAATDIHAKALKKGGAGKDVKSMSQADQITLALSAAPSHIAGNAAVMVFGEDSKLKEAKQGTNGFTCVPTVMNLPEPDPMCMDPSAKQWLDDLVGHVAKPTNTVPGIAYMARGGSHWEKGGKVVMQQETGAKIVKEPPHWMIMWPFDAKEARLPTVPNSFGSYVMFEDTPYAHLMVYQDPKKMK